MSKQQKGVKKRTHPQQDKLTKKERVFCAEMLNSGNATLAAIKAGYPEASANSKGWVLRRDPRIVAHIEEEYRSILNSGRAARSLALIRKIGYITSGNIGDILNEDGTIKKISQWPGRAKHRVASYTYYYDRYDRLIPKITMVDPLRSSIEELKLLNPPPVPGQLPPEPEEDLIPVLEESFIERMSEGLSPEKQETFLQRTVENATTNRFKNISDNLDDDIQDAEIITTSSPQDSNEDNQDNQNKDSNTDEDNQDNQLEFDFPPPSTPPKPTSSPPEDNDED